MTNASVPSSFVPTRWTLVLRARGQTPEARTALNELCSAYYQPVYRFLRRDGHDEEAARELTQEFFYRILQRGNLGTVDPARGRFRSYLLGAVKHFLADQRKYENRHKRGGGAVLESLDAPAVEDGRLPEWPDESTIASEAWFDRQWALAVMERALNAVADEYANHHKTDLFDQLKPWLMGDAPALSPGTVASHLGLTAGAMKVAIHRLRKRFREVLRTEIAQTLAEGDDLEAEVRYLASALAQEDPRSLEPAKSGRNESTPSLREIKILFLAFISLVLTGSCLSGVTMDLDTGFLQPPAVARPWVYWFWLDGNITKEGITADLEAMQRVGLGGALWMWGGGVGDGVKGPVKFLSPPWWDLMRHTVQEADRLGLKINLTAGSGWSHSGGPWIKPEHSMQRLELSREFRLTGPGIKTVALRDHEPLVAALAYPWKGELDAMHKAGVKVTPSSEAPGFPVDHALDQDPATRWISQGRQAGEGPIEAHPQWLVFEFPDAFKATGLYVAPFHDCGPRHCQWQVSPDGKEYQTICRFELDPNLARTIPFATPAARFYRLLITSAHPFQGQASWNVQIAEIQLLQANEQPLSQQTLDSHAVIDLTPQLDASGNLPWNVPTGTWNVHVFRHRSTGDQPHPILPDEGGLECDKLSLEAVEAHWNGYIRRVLDECGPAARRVIRWIHADSYEFGPQTWTPKFREEFKRRCGYDPIPFLPAVFKRVVDSPSVSERFLWDFRRVRADLFAEGIGGHLRALCQREGMALTTEPHLIPEVFDQIQYGGHVSEPVGNFLGERRTAWYAQNPPIGPEVHLAKGEASAAYTSGLNGVVWAEAFTGVDHAHAWKETPEYLKIWGDLWFTEGINRFAFHCWAHSPSLTQKPGVTLGPWGIHFDRRNTWFDLAAGYVTYLSRCQFLLQQGLPVMDVCLLTGDGVVADAGAPRLGPNAGFCIPKVGAGRQRPHVGLHPSPTPGYGLVFPVQPGRSDAERELFVQSGDSPWPRLMGMAYVMSFGSRQR